MAKAKRSGTGRTPEDRLRQASAAMAAEDRGQALRLCRPLIGRRLGLTDQAALAAILGEVGAPEAAAELARAEAGLARALASGSIDERLTAARAMVLMGRVADAKATLSAVLPLAPERTREALLLVRLHLETAGPDDAVAALRPVISALPNPARLLLTAARALGQAGHGKAAHALLAEARPHAAGLEAELAHLEAGLAGRAASGQGEMATQLFDAFAESYDANLASIDNNGPAMIAALLKEVAPPRGRVLDAGCGTGLCAPILRPHARTLTGCDVSVAMLEKARAKKVYDALARTDLGVAATLPAGPFDLIVAADVMTYFGDLTPVLRGLAGVLAPGGWVLFTVEDSADGPAFALGPSGRYRHRGEALAEMLTAAGLGRPKHSLRDTLRTEFGQPLPGLAVAAQKLALFGR